MATSGGLIQRVAEICGHSAVNVGTYYKALREAGLTSKSGRGRSAAQMSVRDVANLLIALSSGASAKDSVDEVRRIRAFKRRPAEGTLRSAALDGLIEGDEFGAFFEHLLTLQIDGKLQPMLSSLPIDLFPINPALAKLSRAQGIKISTQLEQKAASKTDFYIDFEIDDDFVSVEINRYYAGRANVVDGALFFAENSDMERTPGIVTSRKLLNWAIYHIVALLSEGPASRGGRLTMERPAGHGGEGN